MKFKPVLFSLLCFVLSTITLPTYASPQSGQPNTLDWQKNLNLSADQISKVKKMQESGRDELKKMRARKWELYKNIVMMSHDKKIDQNKLNSLIAEMNTLSEKMIRQEIKFKHDIYMTLTLKQQAKLDDMMKKKLKKLEKIYGQ